jgi:hypothetical protein
MHVISPGRANVKLRLDNYAVRMRLPAGRDRVYLEDDLLERAAPAEIRFD